MVHRPAKPPVDAMRRNTRVSCLLETMNTFATPWLCLSPRPLSRYIDHSPSENRSTAPNFRGKISGATCFLLHLPISLFLPRYISNFLSCPKSACPTFIESLRTIDYADFIGFFDYFRDYTRRLDSDYVVELPARNRGWVLQKFPQRYI